MCVCVCVCVCVCACVRVCVCVCVCQARSSHRFEGSNEPHFVRQVSFFFFLLVRFTSAPCLVITQRLCSSNKEIWWNESSTVNVCTIVVLWASARPRLGGSEPFFMGSLPPTSTEVWWTTAFFSSSARRPTAGVQKSTLSMVSAFFILLDCSAHSVVCHSCKVLQSTKKQTKESDMDGQAKLFPFSFSRGQSSNQPKPNPSSSGSSEQIRKPSSSKESISSPLEEEQRSRSQSVSAPSSILGFNIGTIGGRRFLCAMRSVSQKSWSRWADDHEAHDQLELIYVSSCVEGRKCMIVNLKLLTKIGQNLLILETICKNFSGASPRTLTFLKSNSPQHPLGYAPVCVYLTKLTCVSLVLMVYAWMREYSALFHKRLTRRAILQAAVCPFQAVNVAIGWKEEKEKHE